MRICDDLRQAVLQAAIQGKLTKQLPGDRDASDLLKQIAKEKNRLIKDGKIKKEKPLPEITPEEIPFDIPESWQWCRLGDLCSKIGSGNTPSGGKNSNVYIPKGVKFIRSMNVYNDGLHYQGIVYISKELADKRVGTMVYSKDILLNITGGSIGRCALVPDSFDLGSVNQHVLIIRNIFDAVRQYIHICICSPFVQETILKKAVGDKAGYSAEKAKKLLIPLPPLAEQQRIVARVEELMDRIDDLEKTETELEKLKAAFPGDMKAALLQAAIQGKLTKQLPEDGDAKDLINITLNSVINGQKVKEKAIVDIAEDNKAFDIPTNWQWVRLGSVCIVARGGSPRPIKDYITNSPDGINWIKIGDTDKGGKYIISVKEKIKPSGVSKSRFVHSGDFLLTNSMSFGRPYILKVDGCIHDGWLVISQPQKVFDDNYLYLLLSSNYAYKQFCDKVTGAVVKNLNSDKVANSVFPLPPLAEQKRIVEKLDKLLPLCDGLIEK